MAEEFTGDSITIVATALTKDGINFSPALRYNGTEYYVIPYVRMCSTAAEATEKAKQRLHDLAVFTKMTFMFWGLDKKD